MGYDPNDWGAKRLTPHNTTLLELRYKIYSFIAVQDNQDDRFCTTENY